MGVIGWTLKQYYLSSPYEFFLACEGYLIKQDNESALIRLQTFYLARVAGSKIKRPSDLWTLRDEEQKERDTVTLGDTLEERKAMWNKIMAAHGLEKNVIKN